MQSHRDLSLFHGSLSFISSSLTRRFFLVELYQIVELGYIEAQKRKDLSKFIDEGEKDQPRFRARKALLTGFSPTDGDK